MFHGKMFVHTPNIPHNRNDTEFNWMSRLSFEWFFEICFNLKFVIEIVDNNYPHLPQYLLHTKKTKT